MKKRNYSTDFKEETVKLSYQRANAKELADELGIRVGLIYKWRKALREGKLGRSPKAPNRDLISISDYKKLEKELKDKELELEILKKAIHIFSKKDGSTINL